MSGKDSSMYLSKIIAAEKEVADTTSATSGN